MLLHVSGKIPNKKINNNNSIYVADIHPSVPLMAEEDVNLTCASGSTG
jgi:hypothetical protein